MKKFKDKNGTLVGKQSKNVEKTNCFSWSCFYDYRKKGKEEKEKKNGKKQKKKERRTMEEEIKLKRNEIKRKEKPVLEFSVRYINFFSWQYINIIFLFSNM